MQIIVIHILKFRCLDYYAPKKELNGRHATKNFWRSTPNNFINFCRITVTTLQVSSDLKV